VHREDRGQEGASHRLHDPSRRRNGGSYKHAGAPGTAQGPRLAHCERAARAARVSVPTRGRYQVDRREGAVAGIRRRAPEPAGGFGERPVRPGSEPVHSVRAMCCNLPRHPRCGGHRVCGARDQCNGGNLLRQLDGGRGVQVLRRLRRGVPDGRPEGQGAVPRARPRENTCAVQQHVSRGDRYPPVRQPDRPGTLPGRPRGHPREGPVPAYVGPGVRSPLRRCMSQARPPRPGLGAGAEAVRRGTGLGQVAFPRQDRAGHRQARGDHRLGS